MDVPAYSEAYAGYLFRATPAPTRNTPLTVNSPGVVVLVAVAGVAAGLLCVVFGNRARPLPFMKCQMCAERATFHIHDIERGEPRESHLCDEHARQHLTPPEP